MKKILATLLVAAMLMSCLTFVSFAAGTSVYTDESFTGGSLAMFDEDAWDNAPFGVKYNADARNVYRYYINGGKGISEDNLKLESPVFAVTKSVAGAEANLELPATVTPKDVIAIPLYADGNGVNGLQVYVNYDENVLTPVTTYGSGTINLKTNPANGKTALYTAIASDVPLTFAGCLYFVVKPEAKGDSAGATTATTTLTIDVEYMRDAVTNATAKNTGNLSMSVALSGLQPGEDIGGGEEEAEKVTGTDFAAATVAAKGLAVSGFAADTTGVNVVAGAANSNNYKDTDVYSCIFAEVPVIDGYEAIEKAGICLVSSTGYKSYYPSLTTGATTNKFGMVFFGAETLLEKYTAYVYVEYADGTKVLSDDSYTLIGE